MGNRHRGIRPVNETPENLFTILLRGRDADARIGTIDFLREAATHGVPDQPMGGPRSAGRLRQHRHIICGVAAQVLIPIGTGSDGR